MTQNDSLAYWGLSMFPFDDSRNPQFFFPGSKHKEALTRMIYLVKQGNVHLGLFTGEIGAGKTITSMVLQQQIASPDRTVLYLPNAYAEFKHLMAEMIDQLSEGTVAFDTFDEYILTKAFEQVFINKIVKTKKSLVVMLDEAQSYSHDSLLRIKNLTNLGDIEEYSMTFILIGQPELRKFVKSDNSINQRIALRYHLEYLDEDEIFDYIKHRLRIAGHPTGEVFNADVLSLCMEATMGIPREINRFCRLALDNARAKQLDFVDRDSLEEVIYDQRVQEGF